MNFQCEVNIFICLTSYKLFYDNVLYKAHLLPIIMELNLEAQKRYECQTKTCQIILSRPIRESLKELHETASIFFIIHAF